ncbi:MAG: nucleotidyl transferase AbiEii/AbiGii toxin family protein [Marinilabiliaceae bacterium]|nr:nucleotidyl transferase AbiEii/AbiGii toxin family protein [Marinilabiliaceae bacterium]
MYNYSKNFLDAMAAEIGFIRDPLEKMFRLYEVLQFLNSHPSTAERLALKGGTAINLTVFNLPRLSVDIDLDFTVNCNRDEMISTRTVINNDILNFMFSRGYAISPNTKNPHSLDSWVFYFQNAAGNRDNIKIEINYSMRCHVMPIVKKSINVDILGLTDKLATLSTLELFGGKIKALIERNAPRDLYDIQNMLKHCIIGDGEQDLMRKIVIFYLVLGSRKKIDFLLNFDAIDTLKYPQIRANLMPLLKKSERFDFETAKSEVKTYLSQLMILTDNEKMFIENFNKGIYQPELLFNDAEIISRVREHPLAVWKTRVRG